MQLNFGGPVWHASVRAATPEIARKYALRALDGIGDAMLGQWEHDRAAYHVRRRMSIAEQVRAGLAMRDVRHTPEARERVKQLMSGFPIGPQRLRLIELAREELEE